MRSHLAHGAQTMLGWTGLKNDCACSKAAFQNRSIGRLFGAMRA